MSVAIQSWNSVRNRTQSYYLKYWQCAKDQTAVFKVGRVIMTKAEMKSFVMLKTFNNGPIITKIRIRHQVATELLSEGAVENMQLNRTYCTFLLHRMIISKNTVLFHIHIIVSAGTMQPSDFAPLQENQNDRVWKHARPGKTGKPVSRAPIMSDLNGSCKNQINHIKDIILKL